MKDVCPNCKTKDEYEMTDTLFECEHVRITLCVCTNCNAEFVSYEHPAKLQAEPPPLEAQEKFK